MSESSKAKATKTRKTTSSTGWTCWPDEWISFLKTGHIPEDARAPGLAEARERLKLDRMDREERAVYNAHMEALQYQRSVIQTSLIKGRDEGIAEGIAKGIAEEKAETVKKSRAVVELLKIHSKRTVKHLWNLMTDALIWRVVITEKRKRHFFSP